jgi:hypothetical protein
LFDRVDGSRPARAIRLDPSIASDPLAPGMCGLTWDCRPQLADALAGITFDSGESFVRALDLHLQKVWEDGDSRPYGHVVNNSSIGVLEKLEKQGVQRWRKQRPMAT